MTRYGRSARGAQRWRCSGCGNTRVPRIDNTAKVLEEFLAWLTSRQRQADMPGGGRTFRRRCQRVWEIWPLSPICDEIHPVVFVDGLHLGRKAVILIATTEEHVIGWYAARSENARAWAALLARIAPPDLVVVDGASGFEKARKQHWPHTTVQRCIFHVWGQIKTATTLHPRLEASRQLLGLGRRLIKVTTIEQADRWCQDYLAWAGRWQEFLGEKTTLPNGAWQYTHEPVVRVRNAINRLLGQGRLLAFLGEWDQPMPAMNNQIEGGVNAPLRRMLQDHRGMSLTRRIKAIFWWCYLHSPTPLPAAQILRVMPTDADIEAAWQQASRSHQATGTIPQWGDAITWSDLHHTSPYRNTWD